MSHVWLPAHPSLHFMTATTTTTTYNSHDDCNNHNDNGHHHHHFITETNRWHGQKLGPNDTSGIIWAQVSFFFSSLYYLILTNVYFIYSLYLWCTQMGEGWKMQNNKIWPKQHAWRRLGLRWAFFFLLSCYINTNWNFAVYIGYIYDLRGRERVGRVKQAQMMPDIVVWALIGKFFSFLHIFWY